MQSLIALLVIFSFPALLFFTSFGRRIFGFVEPWRADIMPGDENILISKTHFYQQLPPEIKMKFRHRLAAFIKAHDFEGHQQLTITEEMKVLISAAAVHLTLGLNDFELSDFRKIFVYPEVYYSGYSKTTNRGETNPHGIIALTWRFVEEGFADLSDKMNLGYHEFAHALILQHSNGNLGDGMFAYAYQMFCYKIKQEHLARNVEESGLLRDYAFTNKMEFFAVSAEYFLEAPEEMRDKCPDLFDMMVRMLRQDPTHQYYGLKFEYDPEDAMFQMEY